VEFDRILGDLEFRRMRDQLFAGRERTDAPRPAPAPPAPPAARAVGAEVDAPVRYTAVTDESSLRELASRLAALDEIAVDTETSGLDRCAPCWPVSYRGGSGAYYIPISSNIEPQLGAAAVVARAGLLLESVSTRWLSVRRRGTAQGGAAHQVRRDRAGTRRYAAAGIAFGVMPASYRLIPPGAVRPRRWP
jgi:hypothetical protein